MVLIFAIRVLFGPFFVMPFKSLTEQCTGGTGFVLGCVTCTVQVW